MHVELCIKVNTDLEGKIICASGHSTMHRWFSPFLGHWLAPSPGVAILVCIYTSLLIDIFLYASQAAKQVNIVIILSCQLGQWLLHLPPPRCTGQVVSGLCLSWRPGLLCGSSLDRALGILDDQGWVNICVWFVWGCQLLYVCHYWKMLRDQDVEVGY